MLRKHAKAMLGATTLGLGFGLAFGAGSCGDPPPAEPPLLPPDGAVSFDSADNCGSQSQLCCADLTCVSGYACEQGFCVRTPVVILDDASGPPSCGAFVSCDGVCVDETSDPSNCGACGHSCAGAECTGGICSASLIASGLTNAKRMTVDATRVYWTSAGDGTVRAIAKAGATSGSTSGDILAANIASPYGIAVSAASVYFTSEGTTAGSFTDGTVLEVPNLKDAPDGGSAPVVLATAQRRPRTLRVDATSFYWLDYGVSTSDGAALRCPLAGCAGAPTLLAGVLQMPYGLAVNTASVYYTESGGGEVSVVPIAGGNPTSLSSGQQQPSGLAVDANNAFWASYGDGNVARIALTGGTSTTMGIVMGFPQDVATDGTNVYFTDTQSVPGEGAVMRCPIAGCTGAPLVLAASTPTALDVAVDDAFVYWLGSDGSLMRAAK